MMADESEPHFAIAAPVSPGDLLAKKYRVTRVLGAGGMGVVVAADDLDLDRTVAVKFLSPAGAANPSVVARFMREARAAVKITSEHVAKVIEVGKLDSGEPYIVMEFLEGSDLSEVVAQGSLPVEDALDYVLQACEAIAEAHSKGIVHRDIKPANLFVSRRADGSPMVKVLDFGISSMVGAAGEHALTRTGAIMGSPFYMSPEQARSARTANAQSDIWSLGAVLYELIAGRPPFSGETMGELIAAILTEAAPPLRGACPDVPEELDAVVLRCLNKDAKARYASVGELCQALAPFAPVRSRVSLTRAIAVSATHAPDSISNVDTVEGGGTLLMPGASTAKASAAAQGVPATPARGSNTAAAWAETHAPASPSRAWLGKSLAAVAALAALGLAVGLTRSRTSEAAATASALATGSPAIPANPADEPAATAPSHEVPTASAAPAPAPSAAPHKKPAATDKTAATDKAAPAKPAASPNPPGEKPALPRPASSAKTPSLAMPLE